MQQMRKGAVSTFVFTYLHLIYKKYYLVGFLKKNKIIYCSFNISVSLAPHMDFASYVHQYYKSGYLVYQEGGEAGKVCVDHMNKTVPKSEVGRVLNKLGESMCNTLEYSCLLYTSPRPRDATLARMPSSA